MNIIIILITNNYNIYIKHSVHIKFKLILQFSLYDLSRKVFKMPGTSKITARRRAEAYPQDLYADKSHLFCKFCCVGLEIKLSTIKSHISSPKHAKAKQDENASSRRYI